MHAYIYSHTHAYIRTYIHTFTHTCIHTYIHTHAYIHTYVRTYTHIHTFTHMHIYIHTYVHTHTYIHTYTHAYIHTYIHTVHTYIHSHTCIYTYIRTYIHTHTYIHTCIHTYIHTYIHTMHTYIRTYTHTHTYVHTHTHTHMLHSDPVPLFCPQEPNQDPATHCLHTLLLDKHAGLRVYKTFLSSDLLSPIDQKKLNSFFSLFLSLSLFLLSATFRLCSADSLNSCVVVILLSCQRSVYVCVELKRQPFARHSKGIPETRVWNSRKVTLCALVEYLVIT